MALRVVGMVALSFGTGCTSYKVCGHAHASGATSTNLKRTYRLQRIDVRNVSAMPAILWTTEFAFAKTPISAYERLVTRSRPEVFAERPDSVPISVEVSLLNSEGSLGWTILVPYLVTLGIFPAQIQYDDTCRVTVRRLDAPYSAPDATFTFQHKMQVTAFSPIGLGGFEPDPTATAERSGNGILAQPEINMTVRNNIAEALAETMATTIVESLRQMEAAESPAPVVSAVAPANTTSAQASPASVRSPSPAHSSLDEKLKNLKKLRDSGAITEKEYVDLTIRAVNQEK